MYVVKQGKQIPGITTAARVLLVADALDRGRTRSSVVFYASFANTDLVYIQHQVHPSADTTIVQLYPGESYIEEENAHGAIYQGAFYGLSYAGTQVIQVTEELYA